MSSPTPKPTPPRGDETRTEKSVRPPFDIDSLCGLTIDEIRKILGKPQDLNDEPSESQRKIGITTWENQFAKGQDELLVTFEACRTVSIGDGD